ncbi:MAG TPA: hypothetical protein VK753_05320 [Xanthomonadaceae bacterium]|nr:hypothetical protein [Xanthomonadaceae bacterium]
MAVVAHIEGDGAGTPGDIERLLGIHRKRGDIVLIVHRLDDFAIADLDIGRRLHRNVLAAMLHRRRRHVVVLFLPEVRTAELSRNAPERSVKLPGPIADRGRRIEGFAEGGICKAAVGSRGVGRMHRRQQKQREDA